MRKVKIYVTLNGANVAPESRQSQVEDLIMGHKKGHLYENQFGNVHWDYVVIKIQPGIDITLALFRESRFWNYYSVGSIDIDERQKDFEGQCLMIYWDDDDEDLFKRYKPVYNCNAMIKDYLKKEFDIDTSNIVASKSVGIARDAPLKMVPRAPSRPGVKPNVRPDKDGDGKPDKPAAAKPKDTDKDGIQTARKRIKMVMARLTNQPPPSPKLVPEHNNLTFSARVLITNKLVDHSIMNG
ncbi:hypothetical protein SAMD00019534_057330 [Acytostelium subglobosum LB1]|uniref:hypothetical protein n=1 Tax=Acytostelium subglobosum LB1 TaxID=1410327 RepID=UPI000644F5E0|nr:hypothetical protein SAMD00019534_057330 [Acytostelium subglobosum LB1]GAM22558.1 hypothetical protein SAMD00019534_057330 [Acytostelium subglobosum LB1]|eukprot:XP_012754678.1 hypothetical protein SAMD00019534_057330 [Acytostelium subglobosum LB1]